MKTPCELCRGQKNEGTDAKASRTFFWVPQSGFRDLSRKIIPEVVVVGVPPPQPKRKPSEWMVFLFGTMCSLRERDAHCVRDASFGRDVRLRRVSWNTSHHCESSEQHHCAERHNITAAEPLLHLTKVRRPFSGYRKSGYVRTVFREPTKPLEEHPK